MGEAKRNKIRAAEAMPQLEAAAPRVAAVLRKLASAASAQLGSDCYLHADLGQLLLADLGIQSRPVVGFAAWRVGSGDGDVIGHTPHTPGYLPAEGQGFAYHSWLEIGDLILDFTTYQFRKKAADLDAADGGRTSVSWCPDYLLLPKTDVRTYKDVAQAPDAGAAHYEARLGLDVIVRPMFNLDPEDVATARWLLDHPAVNVFGPNNVG